MSVLFVVAGAIGVVWILNDIFKQVLVPRAVEGEFRLSVLLARSAWRLFRGIAALLPDKRREDFLGLFAPLFFVAVIALWIFGLAISYALILYGLREGIRPMPDGFGSTLFFAATTVVPIGSGTFVASDWATRIVVLLAGASGIGTVAVTITFLYAIIGAFQERERFVVVLDSRAGAPPSGVALLETYATLEILGDLPALFRVAEDWVADVLNSHLAYPVLMLFRSSHKDESWVAVLGALLDAANLLVTVIDGTPSGEARLFLDVGMHLTHDLAEYFDLPESRCSVPTPAERDAMCSRLAAAGYGVRDEPERWERFNQLRKTYADSLSGVGQRWLHANAQLVGARTSLPGHAS